MGALDSANLVPIVTLPCLCYVTLDKLLTYLGLGFCMHKMGRKQLIISLLLSEGVEQGAVQRPVLPTLVCVSRPSPFASASGRAPLSPGHCHLLVTGEKGGVDCFLPERKDHLMHLGASRVLAGAGLPPSCKECGRLLRDGAKVPADVVWAGDSHRASERAEACCQLFWPECRDFVLEHQWGSGPLGFSQACWYG